jgi:SnoaL-like domain
VQDRVERVLALSERWNAGDRGFEAIPDYFDPAFEMESLLASLRGEPYRGYAGIEQWVRDLDEQFAEWSITLEDVREIGDQVLTTGTVDARGRVAASPCAFPQRTCATSAQMIA